MVDRKLVDKGREEAKKLLEKASIAITEEEAERIEFCDYGLGDFEVIGTEILTYVNTERVCAKEMMLMPYQVCPEHIHPRLGDYPGKEETFRCRYGEVYLYVPGEPCENPRAQVPGEYRKYMSVWHEVVLKPGEQYVLKEKTLHWFQAGPGGAVISEFSTPSYDEKDIFTDPHIKRESNY